MRLLTRLHVVLVSAVSVAASAHAAPPTFDVNVVNSVLPAETPFQFSGNFTVEGASPDLPIVTVSPGRILVIEHVSIYVNVHGPNGISLAALRLNNKLIFDAIDCHQTGTFSDLNHYFACSEMTKVYANPGESVQFHLDTPDVLSPSAEGFILVSGHFVPAP